MATRLAVPVLTEADVAEMRRILDRAASQIAQGELRELSQLNRAFHGILIRRCENGRLRRVLETLQDQNRIIALLTWEGSGYDDLEHDEHMAIFTAASRGEADLAAEQHGRHIARFGRKVLRIWEERAGQRDEEILGESPDGVEELASLQRKGSGA
jgi:DNA-binding GntR family transcriptional regulator